MAGRSWVLRRLLPLLVILGVAVWYFRGAPREVTLVYDLAGKRDGLSALKVEIVHWPARPLARHVEFYYSASAPPPPQQRQPTRLAPGDYAAEMVLDYGGRRVRSEQRFSLDRQGEIVITP